MQFQNTLNGFNSALSDMANAQNKIQNGFARMYERETPPTSHESTEFVSAFVEEDFAAKLAQAQLKILKSQDEMMDTMINLKS